jgi:hypothetical protein
VLEDPPGGAAEVAKAVGPPGVGPRLGAVDLDVELQHQPPGGHRGGLGFVLVRALGEREQLVDPGDDPIGGIVGGVGIGALRRIAGGPARDPEVGADPAKGRAVGIFGDAEALVDVLMGDLVLEHLDDLNPRPLKDQRP